MSDEALTVDDILDDAALANVHGDRFEHRAVARTVGDLVCASNPPVNIALYGPWGSGKSSFYTLLKARIDEKNLNYRVVQYNAWKYGGVSLKRNFITSVARELGFDDQDYSERLTQDREKNEFRLGKWALANWKNLGIGFLIALGVALLWLLIMTMATWAAQTNHNLSRAVLSVLPGAGAVLSVAFAALLLGPKVLESANVKVSETAPASDDQFVRTFERLVQKATRGGKTRLVVFIDELDRCAPEDVVTTLKDLKTFLDQSHCVFIVAADREVLERALRSVEQANPVRIDEPYYSTPGAFLDKIFQHQFALPPLRGAALTRFARSLVVEKGGLWSELLEGSDDTARLDQVVYTLIPAHVRSPRRVKVLLNNFATNVRVAEARGFEWIDRADEIAYLTVLQTEFPAVASDLLAYPRLLTQLLNASSNIDAELARVLAHYAVRGGTDSDEAIPEDDESPAGEILGDEEDGSEKSQARARLREELHRFLRKAAAAGIQTPRADLLYLQSAGAEEGLSDSRLGEVIDYASDTAPEDVAAEFDGKPSEDLVIATKLLATKSDTEYGPGRSNLVEAACLLVERLGKRDLDAVQARVAPSVLAEIASGGLRINAVPGAIILGAVAASDELVQQLTDKLDLQSLARDGVMDRVSGVLRFTRGSQAERVEQMLGSVYLAAPDPLHSALRDLPAAEANSLWQSQSDKVVAALEELRDSYSTAVESPAAGTQAGAKRTAEHTAQNSQDSESFEPAHSRYKDLLHAVESRAEIDSSLLSAVLLVGQRLDDAETRAVVRDRGEDVLALVVDPASVNNHVFWALWGGALEDVEWWTSRLVDSAKKSVISAWSSNRLILEIPECDQGRVEPLEQALVAVADFVVESEKSPSLLDSLVKALADIPWPDDSTGSQQRRAALHRAAEALRPVNSDAFDEALLDDLESAFVESLEDVDVEFYLRLLSGLSVSASKALDERITKSGDDSILKARARIALRRQSGEAPLDGEMIRSIIETVGADRGIVDDWLASNPEVKEATDVLALQTATTSALDKYARHISNEDRSTLWLNLQGRGVGVDQLRAVGRHGVSDSVVKQMTPKILEGPTHETRQEQVRRFKTALLADTDARRTAADLVERLVGGRVGDAQLAAEIVIHIDGAPHGYVGRIKEAFDKVVADNPRRIPQEQQKKLIALRLLSPPKKAMKGIRGILGLD